MSSSESEILEWSRTIPVFPYWETPAHHALQTSSSCWICCSNSSARVASILDTEAPWGCKNNLTSIAQRMMKHVIFVIIKYLGPSKIDPWKNTRNGYMKWSSTHRPKSVPEAEPPCMVCCTVLGTLPLRFEVRAVAWHHSCGVWCDGALQVSRKFEGTYERWRKMTKNIFNQTNNQPTCWRVAVKKHFSCAWFMSMCSITFNETFPNLTETTLQLAMLMSMMRELLLTSQLACLSCWCQ